MRCVECRLLWAAYHPPDLVSELDIISWTASMQWALYLPCVECCLSVVPVLTLYLTWTVEFFVVRWWGQTSSFWDVWDNRQIWSIHSLFWGMSLLLFISLLLRGISIAVELYIQRLFNIFCIVCTPTPVHIGYPSLVNYLLVIWSYHVLMFHSHIC